MGASRSNFGPAARVRSFRSRSLAVMLWALLLWPSVVGTAAIHAQDWTPPPLPECMCRAFGHRFHLGDNVCLATPEGFRLAQCELTQNVTNWHFSQTPCVISSRAGAISLASADRAQSRRLAFSPGSAGAMDGVLRPD